MSSINYNEFQAGQGVSAPALNENFTLTNNAIENLEIYVNSAVSSLNSTSNLKANKNGSSAENFNVADGTENTHAVNYSQLKEALMPVGSVIWFAGSSAPAGYLLCNGAAVSRTTYANLFNVLGIKYGGGNGSTTFNLPLLTDNRFIEGATVSGASMDAGLPNISGQFQTASREANVSGAFASVGDGGDDGDNDGWLGKKIDFNAARSSSVYGKSSTVQPKSLTMLPCIKY